MNQSKLTYLDHRLSHLIERFPQFVEPSILKDRDRLIAYFDTDFVQKRSPSHLLRLLLSQHLQKKKLLSTYALSPKNKAVEFRILPLELQYPFISKKIIGILVQIALPNRYELFDEDIFQKAVEQLLPKLHMVKGSLYKFQSHYDTIRTFYAEFEKPGNTPFSTSEITLLKKYLGNECLERVEKLVPYVFKVRNQEEALRNILTLSQEIDKCSDLPQIMISFETQTSEEITFTVIGVRAEDHKSISLENLTLSNTSCKWILERKQLVRYLQDHEPIVAYLFRVLLIPDTTVLRSDGSLNFFAARQKIAAFLKSKIGEYRDFNGGILIKQEEVLSSLRTNFPHISSEQVENIFYSISPIEMQTILPKTTLQTLIDLTIQISNLSLNGIYDYHLISSSKPPFLIAILKIPFGPLYDKAKDHLASADFPEHIQSVFSFSTKDAYIFGYLVTLEDQKFCDKFVEALSKLLSYWSDEAKKLKTLRLSLTTSIHSLDPRIGGDAVSSIFLKLLFEGLTRIGPTGQLELAIAHHIEQSEDLKTYFFHLKPSFWSNGDPLTSHDFEYAWKKILSPDFHSPYSYLFFCIKNAEKAKKQLVPMQSVGIHSVNDHLLKVELTSISPHFLEMLSLPIFSPIHILHDTNIPNWPFEENGRYVCNGAFKIEKNNNDNSYIFVKSPLYWEKNRITLDRVMVTRSHHSQSLELFLNNQIHWLGAPLGAWDPQIKQNTTDVVMNHPDNGIFWAVCETSHPLLCNAKIRRALSVAIDREALLTSINYPNDPAFSFLPPMHSQITENPYPFSVEEAQALWKEGLIETGFSEHNLPLIEINFTGFIGKRSAEAVCSSWQSVLKANCRIQGLEFKEFINNLGAKQFHVSLVRWQPWVNDPFYTLNCFLSSESSYSFTHCLDPNTIELIRLAQRETDPETQKKYLKSIEEEFIRESFILPLFKTYYQSVRKKNFKFKINHTVMDFKWGHLEAES
ncbi:peptide ABC transporter substrate-binding protein [Rhabdochlamydiaceae symbiont of Dictyostelium giganteum]|uniref:peptide ABC transporter substrate-binding protein n=1 Tax=Rhabdochlamydiaceae symbiont of Dictyostelium giganteum TaxID=3342349 RepID=UPI00384C9450